MFFVIIVIIILYILIQISEFEKHSEVKYSKKEPYNPDEMNDLYFDYADYGPDEELAAINYNNQSHITKTFRLTGVTYDDRQRLISNLKIGTKIKFKPDEYNQYDRHAIAIIDYQGNNLGWVPSTESEEISRAMTNGKYFYSAIREKLGGNGYNYGLEVIMSTDKGIIDRNSPVDKTIYKSQNYRLDSYSNNSSDEDEDYKYYNESYAHSSIETNPEEYDEDGERGWWADTM